MQNFTLRNPDLLGTLALSGICFGGFAVYALLRRPTSPDELERKRRDMLVQQGRIIDGTVIDISDLSPEESGRPLGLRLILYKYEIAGVVYECSQDVTMLGHLVDIYNCRLGFPASVRYAPNNPGNSLIVAETWSGLRDTARSVSIDQPKVKLGRGANQKSAATTDENASSSITSRANNLSGV